MKSLYIVNGDLLEVDWHLVRAVTNSKFVAKIMEELRKDWSNKVFSAKNYNDSIEIIIKGDLTFDVFQYYKGDINHIHLTNSEVTEMYQSI